MGRRPHRAVFVVVTLSALMGVPTTPYVRAEDQPIRLTDAAERGAFNVGAAQGTVDTVADPTVGGDVLKFDYRMPRGTAAGVWAKAFPDGLNADRVDIVDLGVRVADAGQLRQIAVTVEIKGTTGVQHIPLSLQPEWTHLETTVDWPTIGSVKEVVVAVSRTGDDESAAGLLYLDVRFEQLSWLRKLSMSPAARIGGVALVSLLGALLTALLGTWSAAVPVARAAETAALQQMESGLRRDFVQGVAAVAIAALGVGIYLLGERGPLQVGWTALSVAVAGAVLAEWLKFGLTGRHLTAGEVFQDMLVTGLLAASASPLAILQAPAVWSDTLLLSRSAAATIALLYHAANACRLSTSGRHLSAAGAGLIVGTPYAVGSLLLLRPDALGGYLTVGALAFLGRVLVVFGFNEVAANGLSLATKRMPLRSLRAHLALLVVAAAVIASPWIAADGSGATVAAWSGPLRLAAAVVTAMLSQAGLWAEVYLITGLVMDAIHGQAPSAASVCGLPVQGMKKAMVFSGVFMAVIYVPGLLGNLSAVREFAVNHPIILATLFGAATFPLVKTVIETFDGSPDFFRRLGKSYRDPVLYIRGVVVGLGLGYAIATVLSDQPTPNRAWFGFVVGAAAFAGVDFLRDCWYASQGRGEQRSWRVYLVQSLLGGFVGAAIGFYFDAAQVAAVADKFQRYLAAGTKPQPFDVYPLLSKWGRIDLGTVTGGVSLLFAESLAGVIEWSIPAWLFAINRTFLTAYFQKETAPIEALFTRAGLVGLTENMIVVFRWGLWMSPIIKSFLRPVGEPTWYNQDGAVRTLIATVQDLRLSPDAFRAWSLHVFVLLLAYDSVRVLIWLDHMGLRVATLVNLSFLGMDRLDRRLSRFLAPAATARCIPEAVKRFTTWAPLIIPFYIPRGKDWDYAWSQSEAIQRQEGGGVLAAFVAWPLADKLLVAVGAVVVCTALVSVTRRLRLRFGGAARPDRTIANTVYEVVLKANGGAFSQVRDRGYDVTRRSYDLLDPAGRTLFLVDATDAGQPPRAWPVIGNYPAELAAKSRIESGEHFLKVINTSNGLRTTIEITLPGADDPAELWTVSVENLTDAPRPIKVVPYLEWVLNRPEADRGHTQYNRLYAEMEYVRGLHAVLARDKHSKAVGLLASDVVPDGCLMSRIDFIGRARSLWAPRVLETLAFAGPEDTAAHPTFDPIGSLLVGLTVPARGSVRVRFLIGLTTDTKQAANLIGRYLPVPTASVSASRERGSSLHPIGHGEAPPGTPRPYSEFSEDGRKLLIHTPFTPRPIDHVLSNRLGHAVEVTNRGPYTTSSVNSQQNRLTPDWPDIVTREVPAEAFYLYDPDRREWFSPTYHPLNDADATYEVEFGVDGTAVFHMTRGELEMELTVFVPPDEPTGVYLLTVRNRADAPRRLRLAPYFQMVLAAQPEHAGPLEIRRDRSLNALFFENPRNTFRSGPAFVALSLPAERMETNRGLGGFARLAGGSGESLPAERVETNRGRFFGAGRGVAHPIFVERGEPDSTPTEDDRPVAAFLTTLELPAHGECTAIVLLGQADDRKQAAAVIRKYARPGAARVSLEETRTWWLSLMDTVRVQTSNLEFDHYLDWLKYQTLAERIWARRGFYQASGAFGFRDQLQDAVNLIWMDPAIARRQILLHASQQFLAGDVVHWFHLLQDGRTGFVGRTHASDNLLWLAWGMVDYIDATGDDSILDERTPYLETELPFAPLPADKQGMGFDPLRSARADTVYRHCLKAIDRVLDQRLGAHGLPLMGTGDWNDGLDEIGSQGRGESVWLGLFLYYILERMADIVGRRDGRDREDYYRGRLQQLRDAVERTWKGDRYLRAIDDDGIEIGVKGSGVWEIDALMAAWTVMAGINPERGWIAFDTALGILEQENTILLGWPPLREDTKPYLGRSSSYPEGVRENGMYCHGVQWLVGAARILAERCECAGDPDGAGRYRETAYRLWLKISPIPHVAPGEIESYGGQPNKQAADMVTTFDPGRMIWHGYTGSAGWMFRQALEGVLGLRLSGGEIVLPADGTTAGELGPVRVTRDVSGSPLPGPAGLRTMGAIQEMLNHRDTETQRNHKGALLSFVISLCLCVSVVNPSSGQTAVPAVPPFHCPTVPPEHKHVRALLENALRYAAPDNRPTDPVSGYPFEGWNHDPKQGLYLRSFTQLTAIGLWMELLANVAAGQADTPHLSRERALSELAHLVKTLRLDQRNPRLGAKGLLGNFLDLSSSERLGPLASDVEKQKFLDAFGQEKGETVWKALAVQGWIVPQNNDREAAIQRGAKFGANFFDGALTSFRDDATKQKIMAILDRRVVMIVFGDNANLSTSVAKTIGALLSAEVKDRPGVADLRRDLEQFLEHQREGYARLYDAKAGLFYFGWDAGVDRLFGWTDLQGKWVTGHADYLINEFRGPTTFVALRFGLPIDAVKNLGFKMKPYPMRDGRKVYTLAPWEGSAFQALGLVLWLNELASPSWRALLETAVEIEIDYSTRNHLPGFLSESYTGNGVQYSGTVGIPAITVSPKPRITDAASLYTLGAAYTVAPARVEQFLTANWGVVSTLLTDHGPWEGFNITQQEPIRFQTSSHTLALVLGILRTGSDQMVRYLDSQGLSGRLAEVFRPGEAVDLLADEVRVFAWAPKDQTIRSTRDKGGFHVQGERVSQVGIAFVSPRPQGVNLSGGLLSLRYRCAGPAGSAVIDLKPVGGNPADTAVIPNQVFTRLADTAGRDEEIQISLPATPGLTQVKEVVITYTPRTEGRSINLAVTRFGAVPIGPGMFP